MSSQNLILISVTIPVIATGLLIWAKLRRMIILLEEIRNASRQGQS